MSANEPIQPQRRELEIIRVLFDRQLDERAVALAETRWPGSGKMIELAYQWSNLSPGERRQRLSELGPEQTHRFRALATLHPDLQRAVDEMEQRGVFEEMQDAALDRVAPDETQTEAGSWTSESSTEARADDATADVPEERRSPEPTSTEADSGTSRSHEEALTALKELESEVEQLKVEMPDLDLGLPSTSEFLTEQNQRREASLTQAQSMMERVHQRLSASADSIMSRSSAVQDLSRGGTQENSGGPEPAASEALGESPESVSDEPGQLPDPDSPSRMIEAPATLLDRFRAARVVSLAGQDPVPSEDQLVALANELDVGIREFEVAPGKLREVFGGLQRHGSSIDTVAGPLPSALAEGNLVVVRGRIHPKIVERMREGWADIPGTRATVKMHDRARLLLLP